MAGIPMIFKRPEKLPCVMKFDETVDFRAAQQPVRMFKKVEVVIEDEEDLEISKERDFSKKKQIRHFYKPKWSFALEDNTERRPNDPPRGFQYDGDLSNVNPGRFEDVDTRYTHVLLKRLTEPGVNGGPPRNIIHLVPIAGTYMFKKPSPVGQQLLEDVEQELNEAKKKRSESSRVKKILGCIKELGNGTEEDDGDAISQHGIFHKAKGGARFKGLTENGLDLEELEKEKLATMGDYDRPIADNDDEYVVTGQEELMDAVAADENHTTAGQRSDDDDDEEDDDDDNDSDNDSDDRGGVGGASAGGGHGAKAESSSGFLTDSLMNEASLLQATISISVTSKTKRSERDDEGDVESDMQTNPKRVKFEESKKTAGSMLSSSSATKGGGSKTGSVSGAQLTDEYMRNYIRERGGKVTHDELKDHFKSVIKQENKAGGPEKRGAERFKDIVMRTTLSAEDVTVSKLLRLRE